MGGMDESRFNMWRAVVAMIHADNVVQPHEVNFILENTRNLKLSESQRTTLVGDISHPADIAALFRGITNRRDKEDFFHLARAISWADGHLDDDEEDMLAQMRKISMEKQDEELLRSSIREFQMIYVEGKVEERDPGFIGFVKGLMGRRGG